MRRTRAFDHGEAQADKSEYSALFHVASEVLPPTPAWIAFATAELEWLDAVPVLDCVWSASNVVAKHRVHLSLRATALALTVQSAADLRSRKRRADTAAEELADAAAASSSGSVSDELTEQSADKSAGDASEASEPVTGLPQASARDATMDVPAGSPGDEPPAAGSSAAQSASMLTGERAAVPEAAYRVTQAGKRQNTRSTKLRG